MITQDASLTAPLTAKIAQAIEQAGGFIGFDHFMHLALYAPEWGYYTNAHPKIGLMPAQNQEDAGSDFATAPQMSSLFGKTIAAQIAQALQETQTDTIYEFGAGTGVLALDILQTLGEQVAHYCIVDVSGSLRAKQQETLAAFAHKVRWIDTLPECIHGILLGNEVLDAMPVKLLQRRQGQWYERGVALRPAEHASTSSSDENLCPFVWADQATALCPPVEIEGQHDYLTEVHPQAEAFIRTTSERLAQGAALWIDYGFGEREYYHPERHMGTLMCHHQHQLDDNPLILVGQKDITSHVNFTAIAVAAQEMGLEVLGYTSQGRFLINCGIAAQMEKATLAQQVMASKLVAEHEMGELFKVMLLGKGPFWDAIGFRQGDRTHTL